MKIYEAIVTANAEATATDKAVGVVGNATAWAWVFSSQNFALWAAGLCSIATAFYMGVRAWALIRKSRDEHEEHEAKAEKFLEN